MTEQYCPQYAPHAAHDWTQGSGLTGRRRHCPGVPDLHSEGHIHSASEEPPNSESRSAAKQRGYDKAEVERRTCQSCGMLLDDAGEYHPYPFCVLKKAGLNPWPYAREICMALTGVDPGEKPPLVRSLR